jgi:hypothetical protein
MTRIRCKNKRLRVIKSYNLCFTHIQPAMKSKFYLLIPALLVISLFRADAQGCVAIRSYSGCGSASGASAFLSKGDFLIGTNARYFKSYKHFRGTHEEVERVENGTEVINKSAFLDFSLNYGITNRMFASATLPFTFHHRTSMYEHGGNPPNGLGERHATSSQGLGDVRVGIGYWLFNPAKKENFNYALGLGVKLNTGKYDVKDTFYNQKIKVDGVDVFVEEIEVVDQSIQLGDGGISPTLDLQGYHILSNQFSITTTLFYQFGIEESNGILTRNQQAGGTEFAVPDQYLARLGINYVTPVNGLSFYVGGRMEGVPAEDLIGGSNAYRRPGYSIAIEPGITYNASNLTFNLSVPFAIERNRVQSYLYKVRTEETGMYTHGDAAFADYLINFGVTYRINNNPGHSDMMMSE